MSQGTGQEDGRYDARKRAKEMREKAIRAEARRGKTILFSIIGGVVVLALAVVLFIVNNAPDTGKLVYPKGLSGYTLPVSAAATPKADAPNVTVLIDFQCPVCQQFETTNGANLNKMAADGDIKLNYQIRTFLGAYSARAGNVAACVYNDKPENFAKFAELLFATQPSEQVGDNQKPQNADLLKLAQQAGAGDITQCISTNQFGAYIEAGEKDAQTKSQGTPTIYVNDKRLTDAEMGATLQDATAMQGFIAAAKTPATGAPAATTPATGAPAATTPAK